MNYARIKLGEILLAYNIISDAELAQALTIQQKTGGRLGDIIIAKNFTSYLKLYGAVAEHYNLPFVNLLELKSEKNLLNQEDIGDYIKYCAIPWQKNNDGKFTIAICELSEEIKNWTVRKYGKNVDFVITSPLDIRKILEAEFGELLEENSRLQLWQETPENSARYTIPQQSKIFLWVSFTIFAASIFLFSTKYLTIFITICTTSYCANMLVKLLIFIKSIPPESAINWENELQKLDEKTLPIYTILVAMYKEKESIPKIISALKNMDYPSEKLDIKLVLEEDDTETYEAAIAAKPSYNFEIIRVPESDLRTKPKALNYAIKFARGEYITVFDADDLPEKTQLKKAIITFRERPKNVACLQARLNYYNANQTWLTRFFSLEYSLLFDFLLRGLQRLNIPLPLGGTSNHISLAHIRELGFWDPFNVTEDADLGVRISALGLKTEMLDSYTMEEATATMPTWILQRSRWIKGYMQTWLVHMRSPISLYKTIGGREFWGFQFFIGFASFSFLTAPIIWLLAFFWWVSKSRIILPELPEWLVFLSLANLVINFISHWFMMFFCLRVRSEKSYKTIVFAITYPFYLIMHSIASYKGLWQLIVKPHFWEKTMHGVAKAKKSE